MARAKNRKTLDIREYILSILSERGVSFDLYPRLFRQQYDVLVVNDRWKIILMSQEDKPFLNNHMPEGFDGVLFVWHNFERVRIWYNWNGWLQGGLFL